MTIQYLLVHDEEYDSKDLILGIYSSKELLFKAMSLYVERWNKDHSDSNHQFTRDMTPEAPFKFNSYYSGEVYYQEFLLDGDPNLPFYQPNVKPLVEEAVEVTCWYVSSRDGDDDNDGLTPETPKQTLGALLGSVKQWDKIYFRRDGIYTSEK